jgi:thiol-disulfide isomerase/thioredoxin
MKKVIIAFLFVFIQTNVFFAQQITGKFSALPNQSIKLQGFDNFDTYVIDSTQTDAEGNFTLKFTQQNYGMGLLKPESNKPFITVLNDEYVNLKGATTAQPESIHFTKGKQNIAFNDYVNEQPQRKKALNAWDYLQKMYSTKTLFKNEKSVRKAINKEIKRLHKSEASFLNDLPAKSYVKWYISKRNLLGSVAQVAQYQTEEIPATRKALRKINYADNRLYKSGLLKDAIKNHIWFIENSSGDLDSVFADLNLSIDVIADQLKDEDKKFNLVLGEMFDILEKRSLFTSSEYLAQKLLKSDDCGCLNPKLQKKLERYGKMAKGKTAPNIAFSDYTYYPEGVDADNLKALDAKYKVVVFAAGWCPHCNEAMPKIVEHYEDWKANNAEVVMVSLDENAKDFAQFAAPLPFISTADYKKWDSKAVKDYQVYATPSYFILDKDLKILIRAKSVAHINAWLKSKN